MWTLPSPPKSLSPRERDCLRLLQTGLLTPQVAANLGISLSTLNKHLASARQKLGVGRTAQAVLLCQREGAIPHNDARHARRVSEQIAHQVQGVCDFDRELQSCGSFDEAWSVMLAHAARFGVTYMTSGVVAEPPGQVTNGARVIKVFLPGDLPERYFEMGGASVDPTVHFVANNTHGALTDNEIIIRKHADKLPKPALVFGEALIDQHCRFMFHQPERDSATGAPIGTGFTVAPEAVADFRRDADAREGLRAMSRLFWDFVQAGRMMRHVAGLTNRQADALRFAARGFTVAETAEHMSVSVRSVEKTLAAARDRLNAPTTAAALYRAMVYRVLV